MPWDVVFTDEFGEWWEALSGDQQDEIDVVVRLLEEKGPHLPFPYSSKITTSRHAHMRELRVQHRGTPYRILYAFDPRRVAVLLIGGSKAGDDRWYDRFVPLADRLYERHLQELKRKGLIDGS